MWNKKCDQEERMEREESGLRMSHVTIPLCSCKGKRVKNNVPNTVYTCVCLRGFGRRK